MRSRSLKASFTFAFTGLAYAFRTQRNMRVHTLTATVVIVLGTLLRLPRRDFISVLAAIMVVMVAEMVNTALESVVDIASPHYHPLARIAKDVAAGAVLLAASGAAALGVWVFGPRLGLLPAALHAWWFSERWAFLLMVMAVLMMAGLAVGLPITKRGEDRPD